MENNLPVITDAYIKMRTGKLSLVQVQQIFSTIPFDVDLIDAADRFAFYSDKAVRVHPRHPDQINETVAECHPAKALPHVMAIINSFRDGSQDLVERAVMSHGHRVLTQYYALRDSDGQYLGTLEFTGYVDHILDLAANGAWAAATGADVVSGASQHDDVKPDVTASNAQQGDDVDTVSGASKHVDK